MYLRESLIRKQSTNKDTMRRLSNIIQKEVAKLGVVQGARGCTVAHMINWQSVGPQRAIVTKEVPLRYYTMH
jgi:23S rRNA A1618 N6-methylase RlmF